MNIDIISIVITLIIAIPGLITFFKIKQTKIVYLEKQIINLKDDLLKNFDELSIKYKNVEIQNDIYFVSGFLVCQGNKDILFEDKNIEIYIPDGSKWLDFKIVSKPIGMKSESKIEKNKVEINFDLLKSKEFTEYEAIIELNDKTKYNGIDTLLCFYHRIPNIPKIKNFDIGRLKSYLNIFILSCVLAFLPVYTAYDMHNLNDYELKTFNADTDEEINSILVQVNDTLEKLHQKIVNEYSGFEILFKGKTNTFPVKISPELASVYFKVDSWSIVDWIFAIIFSVLFIISIGGFMYSIKLFYYQKKYLSLIKK